MHTTHTNPHDPQTHHTQTGKHIRRFPHIHVAHRWTQVHTCTRNKHSHSHTHTQPPLSSVGCWLTPRAPKPCHPGLGQGHGTRAADGGLARQVWPGAWGPRRVYCLHGAAHEPGKHPLPAPRGVGAAPAAAGRADADPTVQLHGRGQEGPLGAPRAVTRPEVPPSETQTRAPRTGWLGGAGGPPRVTGGSRLHETTRGPWGAGTPSTCAGEPSRGPQGATCTSSCVETGANPTRVHRLRLLWP